MFALLIVLIILIIAAIAYATWQSFQNKNAQNELDRLLSENEVLEKSKEEFFRANIELTTKLDALERQMSSEQSAHEEQKKMLLQQLELIGKDLVAQGSKTLKIDNQTNLAEILNPFKEKLERFEKEVKQSQVESLTKFSNMETIIKMLSTQHEQMNSTAQSLVDALRGENKVQGDWGELALERILENSGLIKGQEYSTQSSFKDDQNKNVRPDVIIHLPDNKQLIIDSKVSLKAFEKFINEDDYALKQIALKEHINSLKTHIKQLGEKDYSSIAGINSPEFVLLFIPLESSFALAVKEEPGLYQMAMDKKIILVTPSTLLATLKTVDSIWKHERQNKNAIEIAEQAGRLYDKFVNFVADLEKVGSKQKEALAAHEEATRKLYEGNGNLIRSAEKLKKLGVKSKKNIDKKYLSEDELEANT